MRQSDNPALAASLAALRAGENVSVDFKAAVPAPVTTSASVEAIHKQVVDLALTEANFFVRVDLQRVESILYRLANDLHRLA